MESYFKEVITDMSKLISYHYTPFDYDIPSYEKIVENRDNRKTHANSYLGLWSCTYPSFFEQDEPSEFGKTIYKIKYKDNVNIGFIGYGDFVKYCHQIEDPKDYISEHYRLIDLNYDVVIVYDRFSRESNSYHCGEIITLNLDCMEIFEKINYSDIKNYDYYIQIKGDKQNEYDLY